MGEALEHIKKVRLPCPEVSPHSCEPRGELFFAHECDRFRASGVHHKGEMPDQYNCNPNLYTKSRIEKRLYGAAPMGVLFCYRTIGYRIQLMCHLKYSRPAISRIRWL